MHAPFLGVVGHDKVARRVAAGIEPEEARLIGQRDLQGIVLMPGSKRRAIAEPQSAAHILPLEIYVLDTLPFHIPFIVPRRYVGGGCFGVSGERGPRGGAGGQLAGLGGQPAASVTSLDRG